MMKFKEKTLLKEYKRYINTKVLREALIDMTISSKSTKIENLREDLLKLETIEVKIDTKPVNIVYEDILENIRESENYLAIVKQNLELTKKNQLNLNIEVKEVKDFNDKEIIHNLNDKTGYFGEKRNFIEINNKDTISFSGNENEGVNTLNNLHKSVFDISWLQPFTDFMHNHSTLVFTVGGGMLLGGMLYLNSFGLINIGSLLARIGINLFGSNTNIVNPINSTPILTPTPINISIESTSSDNNVRQISSGFFKELGKKLLEMIDLYIEKLKDGRQKYK